MTAKMNKPETINVVTATDSYHYYGLWNNSMCFIKEDGTLENIRRNPDENSDIGITHLTNEHNQCGTRDAMDIDSYEVEDESSLVYFKDKVMNRSTALTTRDGRYDVEVIFNKESIKHVKKVTESINKEYGARLNNLTVSYEETFIEKQDRAEVEKRIKEVDDYIASCTAQNNKDLADSLSDNLISLPSVNVDPDQEIPF